jgi:hypothetical protein
MTGGEIIGIGQCATEGQGTQPCPGHRSAHLGPNFFVQKSLASLKQNAVAPAARIAASSSSQKPTQNRKPGPVKTHSGTQSKSATPTPTPVPSAPHIPVTKVMHF